MSRVWSSMVRYESSVVLVFLSFPIGIGFVWVMIGWDGSGMPMSLTKFAGYGGYAPGLTVGHNYSPGLAIGRRSSVVQRLASFSV